MNKTEFMTRLTEIRKQWEELLAQIGEARMTEAGATGKWSVKDVIAHITWSEREVAPVMQSHVLAGSELWELSDYERNEIVYGRNRDRSLSEVIRDEGQAYKQFLGVAQTLSDEDLNDSGRYRHMPPDWVPWQLFAANSFDHYLDHMKPLREWLDMKG